MAGTKWAETNRQLRDLYEEYGPYISSIAPRETGYSFPLFMRLPEAYFEQTVRIMVIGQETHGWDLVPPLAPSESATSRLLDMYAEFENGRRYYRSPFWLASHNLQLKLNPGSDPCALAWTNLGRVDQHRARATNIGNDERLLQLVLLEVEIAKPDCVVFWTGPNYESMLEGAFLGVEKSEFDAHSHRELARLIHPSLPTCSYRTYHPNYLSRSRRLAQVLQSIVSDTIDSTGRLR